MIPISTWNWEKKHTAGHHVLDGKQHVMPIVRHWALRSKGGSEGCSVSGLQDLPAGKHVLAAFFEALCCLFNELHSFVRGKTSHCFTTRALSLWYGGTTGECCLHKQENIGVCLGFCQGAFQRQVKVCLVAGMGNYLNREAPCLGASETSRISYDHYFLFLLFHLHFSSAVSSRKHGF